MMSTAEITDMLEAAKDWYREPATRMDYSTARVRKEQVEAVKTVQAEMLAASSAEDYAEAERIHASLQRKLLELKDAMSGGDTADEPRADDAAGVIVPHENAGGLGHDEKGIASLDTSGVALAAIQGLNQLLGLEVRELREDNAELVERIEQLEAIVAGLTE